MRTLFVVFALMMLTFAVHAEVVSERFGGRKGSSAHPDSLKVTKVGSAARYVFDLSAIPKGATVYRSLLSCSNAGRGQPRLPIQVVAVAKVEKEKITPDGKALKLVPPMYRAFDATDAVRKWAKTPEANRGFAVLQSGGFDMDNVHLDVWYDGKAQKVPEQVTGIKVVHANGQTFVVWKEFAAFQPGEGKTVWVDRFDYRRPANADGPGKNPWGSPRVAAITLETLRGLEGVEVRLKKGPGQRLAKQKRIRKLPNVRYRIYRSKEKITPQSIGKAEFLGSSVPLNGYEKHMIMGGHIACRGEYYDQREIPESIFRTYCYGDGRPLVPGEAYYVHTLKKGEKGKYYYAVSIWKDGVENLTAISSANSLETPVEEAAGPIRPVPQFIRPDAVRRKSSEKTLEYWHNIWRAPPVANMPHQHPMRVIIEKPDKWKAPGALHVTGSSGAFFGAGVTSPHQLLLVIEGAGGLCSVDGQGTLKSYKESTVTYADGDYTFLVLDWAVKKWKADPNKISGGGSVHFAARHPKYFHSMLMGPPFASGYALDFDQKWNPASRSLSGRLGPPKLVKTRDGRPAWDEYNFCRYLLENQDKDIPFLGCMFSQPKDGNHGVEYGWQDDPKGLAALRDARQPYAATWGGVRLPGEVTGAYARMRWDKTLPAFSNCSLDNFPGNGDPDDGDPWGQINGYLLWNHEDSVDKPDQWEMTVYLVGASRWPNCTVDITPRHCHSFKAKPGDAFSWTNTDPKANKEIAKGKVKADKWGIVTLKQVTVSKDRNRIKITKVGQ